MKWIILGLGLLCSGTAMADGDYISDGSDVIHHDVKKATEVRLQFIFNDNDEGVLRIPIRQPSDDMTEDQKVFKHGDEIFRVKYEALQLKNKVVLAGVITDILNDEDKPIVVYPFVKAINKKEKEITDIKIKNTPVLLKATLIKK